jgi:aspartate-semialdehyde dehydrogenase
MKRIGIAGATGLVGETLLRLVEPDRSGVEEVRLFASEKSAGRKVSFRDGELEVRALDPDGFEGLDVAFSCLGADLAAKVVPGIAKHCPVIDKSSRFRLDAGVPLVVPEVNPGALAGHAGIIANPNCTTIPLVVAVGPLHRRFGLERIWLASYQSASGAGRPALEQLQYETEFIALGRDPDTQDSPLPAPLAGNVIPQIDGFDAHGNTGEETKTIRETAKILGLPDLKVTSTCVRVPVAVGHSLAVTCRFSRPVRAGDALRVLRDAPGVALSPGHGYPTPLAAAGRDEVFIGRVRPGAAPEELSLWVVTDNLRKGAALNAVQIARLLAKEA